jgi:long-subunit fatty acid transport protein
MKQRTHAGSRLRRTLAQASLATSLLAGAGGAAHAGGLFVPGIGAISTSRAGAATASVAGPDAIAINPAGLAKTRGTVVSISASLVDYNMAFTRAGTYDASADAEAAGVDIPWAGEAYPTVYNEADPKIGLGGMQAVPLIAVSSDLGNAVPGLRIAAGVFGPSNAFPDRAYEDDYELDSGERPSPARYNMVRQEAAVMLPSIGAAYSITDKLDVGATFSAAISEIKAGLYLWGVPQNFSEWTGHDTEFNVEAKDNFSPHFKLGALFRPHPNLEIGAQYHSKIEVQASGTGSATVSQFATIGGIPTEITPPAAANARCGTYGTPEALAACVDFEIPMTAAIGARYVFRDGSGAERGDVEFNAQWENWSSERASDFLVIVDAVANGTLDLKDSVITHALKDTWSLRLGGSYGFAVGPGALIARAGVAYDTQAAKPGWERIDLDGAARTTLAAGASYRLARVSFDLGFGASLEGSRDVGDPDCNPTTSAGCDGVGDLFADEQPGVDPIFPLSEPDNQVESPVNAGNYTSRYLLLMLGMSTWF